MGKTASSQKKKTELPDRSTLVFAGSFLSFTEVLSYELGCQHVFTARHHDGQQDVENSEAENQVGQIRDLTARLVTVTCFD